MQIKLVFEIPDDLNGREEYEQYQQEFTTLLLFERSLVAQGMIRRKAFTVEFVDDAHVRKPGGVT